MGLSGTIVAVAVVVLLAGAGLVLWRYRRLERRGTPLPPGAGGARLVGLDATVVRAHRPGGPEGRVRVLGDDWLVASAVDHPLEVGDVVRVVEVEGTHLVVRAAPGAAGSGDASDPSSRPQQGSSA